MTYTHTHADMSSVRVRVPQSMSCWMTSALRFEDKAAEYNRIFAIWILILILR